MEFIGNDWDTHLETLFRSSFFRELLAKLNAEYTTNRCFPPKHQVFRALSETPYHATRVVILGQDPYHTPGAANGLSFSVTQGRPMPPSLRNIFTELRDDLGIACTSTDLTPWARQGILLLNASLSVREGVANSHKDLGWSVVTDTIIRELVRKKDPVLFVLWGSFAQSKRVLILPPHEVFASVHPSPLSASRGFFGSRPFSAILDFLQRHGYTPIDFQLTGGSTCSD